MTIMTLKQRIYERCNGTSPSQDNQNTQKYKDDDNWNKPPFLSFFQKLPEVFNKFHLVNKLRQVNKYE